MSGVCQLEASRVRARRQANQDDGLAACLHEVPRQVVHGDVQVADPRRDVERSRTEHRQHSQVFSAKWNEDAPTRERLGERRVDEEPRWRFVGDGNEW